MTNTPSPDEDRELIEPLCDHCGKPEYKHVQIVGAGKVCQASCFTFSTAKSARIESLLSDRAKLEERVRETNDAVMEAAKGGGVACQTRIFMAIKPLMDALTVRHRSRVEQIVRCH